jgi:hypothetical protein
VVPELSRFRFNVGCCIKLFVAWRKCHRIIQEQDIAARGARLQLVRGLRAVAAKVRPGTELPALDRLWPPAAVDRECRPYELGWLLDCWLGGPPRGETGPGGARGATGA